MDIEKMVDIIQKLEKENERLKEREEELLEVLHNIQVELRNY